MLIFFQLQIVFRFWSSKPWIWIQIRIETNSDPKHYQTNPPPTCLHIEGPEALLLLLLPVVLLNDTILFRSQVLR